MTDIDRFERPKPCKWCGEIFEHRFDCPAYSFKSDDNSLQWTKTTLVDTNVFEKLLSVIKELTDPVEHNYIDWYIHEVYETTECLYCGKTFKPEEEQHKENCPVLVGRKLLEQLK